MPQAFNKVDGDIDVSVKIPEAVRRAAAAADEAQKRFLEENAGDAGQPKPVGGEATPRAASPPPESQPQPKPERNWEQEFIALQGRYGGQQRDVRALSDQVAQLSRALELERVRKVEAPPKQEPYAKLLTDEERTDYGEDFLNVTKRAAREEYEPVIAQLRNELAQVKAQVRGFGAQVEVISEHEMYKTMERAYAGWHALNCSDPWKDWLARPDPFDGQRRLDKLKQQWELRNVKNVLNFVSAYHSELAALSPDNGSTERPSPASAGGRVPLETYAAPGRAKSAAASEVPADKRTYYPGDIDRFYRDVALGHWKGRDQERIAIDRDIQLAGNEGRVIQSRSRY